MVEHVHLHVHVDVDVRVQYIYYVLCNVQYMYLCLYLPGYSSVASSGVWFVAVLFFHSLLCVSFSCFPKHIALCKLSCTGTYIITEKRLKV